MARRREDCNFLVTFNYKFIEMLRNFELMCDDHLGPVKIEKYQFNVSPAVAKPTSSATYQADPKNGEL